MPTFWHPWPQLMRVILALLILIAGSSWTGVSWLVSTFPPTEPLAVAGLYALLFCALATTLTLAAWSLRSQRQEDGQPASPLSFLGHAMLFSSLALFALWLQSLRMLSPLNGGLLVAVYAFIELTVLVGQRAGQE